MSAISRIYIETNWETFTTPYYDSEEDKVYFTYYTEITRLSPTETWSQFFAKYESEVKKIFKEKGYSLIPFNIEKESQIKFPVFEEDEKEICKLESEPEKKTESKFMLQYGRKTVDPRPDGVVKLSYVVNDASKFLDLDKINEDYTKLLGGQSIPPGLTKAISPPKDFNITNYEDFSKIKNINSLKDANDFLGAALSKTNKARLAAKIGVTDPSQVVNIEFADQYALDVREDIKINSLAITNESLRASRTVLDSAQGTLNFIGTTTNTLKTYNFVEQAEQIEEIRKKAQGKLNFALQFANKWGLNGLLECVLFFNIEKMQQAGNVEVARKLFLELERLQQNATEIKLQYNDIKKIFEKGLQISGGIRRLDKRKGTADKIKAELEKAAFESITLAVQSATQSCLLAISERNDSPDFNFGAVGPEIFPSDVSGIVSLPDFTGEVPNPTQIQNFLGDVLANITKTELCRLLQGAADNKLLFFVQSTLKKHPALEVVFKDQQSLAVYFYNLGLQIDTTFCKIDRTAITPNNNLVSYCGSKISKTLADLYKDKLPNPDVQPDLPSISASDLQESLSPELFQNLMPPMDFTPFLEDSYRNAQEDLFSYESLFKQDVLNKIQAPTQKTTKKLSSKEKKEQDKALDDAGLESDGAKGASGNNDGDLGVNSSITDSINEINIENLPTPNFGSIISKVPLTPGTTGFTLFEGGPFNKVDILSNGTYNINSTFPIQQLGPATKTDKSPLTLIGSVIKDDTTSNPAFRKISFFPTFRVVDYYRDVIASVVSFYIDELEKRVSLTAQNPEQILEFYRIARRKRVKDALCEAADDKTEAQEYAADNQKAMDVESLRILTYTLIVERYINLITLASSGLPKSITDAVFQLPDNAVNLIADDFLKLCAESVIEVQVRNVLCDAGLSIEELIKQELEFVQKSVKFGEQLPTVQNVLISKTNLKPDAGNLVFEPSNALKLFMTNYVGKGDVINAAGETKDVGWQDLLKNDIQGKLTDFSGQPIFGTAQSVIALMLLKAAGNYAPKLLIPLDTLPEVMYGFITALYNMVVNEKYGTIDTTNTTQVANKIKTMFLDATYDLEYEVDVKYTPEFYTPEIDQKITFTLFKFSESTTTKIFDTNLELAKQIDSKQTLTSKFKVYQALSINSLVQKNINTAPLETFSSAFNDKFVSLLTSYFLYEYGTKQQKTGIFDQTKAAIISRFSIGTPVLATYDQSVQAYEQQIANLNNPNLKLANMSTLPLWIMILLMIPKLTINAIKSIILSALYFSNPIVYFILMAAESFGLSLSDFLDKQKEDALKALEETLDPDDPAMAKVKFDLNKIKEKQQKNNLKSIIDLKCDI